MHEPCHRDFQEVSRESFVREEGQVYAEDAPRSQYTTKDIASALKSTSLLAGKIILHLDSG
jgi:hypothetical protein